MTVAELRALHAAVTPLTWADSAGKVWEALPALLDRLEAAERDAERYRWLRAPNSDTSNFLVNGQPQLIGGGWLDAAIDAARSKL